MCTTVLPASRQNKRNKHTPFHLLSSITVTTTRFIVINLCTHSMAPPDRFTPTDGLHLIVAAYPPACLSPYTRHSIPCSKLTGMYICVSRMSGPLISSASITPSSHFLLHLSLVPSTFASLNSIYLNFPSIEQFTSQDSLSLSLWLRHGVTRHHHPGVTLRYASLEQRIGREHRRLTLIGGRVIGLNLTFPSTLSPASLQGLHNRLVIITQGLTTCKISSGTPINPTTVLSTCPPRLRVYHMVGSSYLLHLPGSPTIRSRDVFTHLPVYLPVVGLC